MNLVQWSQQARVWLFKAPPFLASLHMSTTIPMLQDATFVCSLGWILYRIWQIYQKPIEELVELLGLDIPPVPEISLAGITAETALLYWKPPDNQPANLRHAIQVNGIKIGDFGRGDASIQVTGLKSGHYYNIRVITTNAANFSTFGPLIRLRTTLAQQANTNSAIISNHDVINDELDESEPATIRATPSHFDATLPSGSQQMLRESSGSHHNSRRTVSGRRSSPSTHSIENSNNSTTHGGSADEIEVEGIIKRLTEKLEVSRREQQEIDKQILEEEQDSKSAMTDLIKERDGLKQILKEKEEASSELRKHGNYLDKLNRTAQSKKAGKEKVLHQKVVERQKLKDDIARWDKEIGEMVKDTDEMASEKAGITAAKEDEIARVRKGIYEDQVLIKSLEEDIRIKGIQIKAIEREREREKPDDAMHEEYEQKRAEKESELWDAKVQATQVQLTTLWQTLQQAQTENQRAQEHLNWWSLKRERDPALFAPIPALDFVPSIKSTRSRRARQVNSRTSTISTSSGGYPTGPLTFNNVSTISPTFSLASPFFNMSNGMAVPPTLDQTSLQQTETETSTDGGAMSPAANDLLPSNLFRDEDLASRGFSIQGGGHETIGSIGSEIFAAQGASPAETAAHGLHTPVSARSRAGSLFSSPHDSLHNLHGYQSRAASFAESDRQSVNSTGGSFNPAIAAEANPLAASRIASLFTTTFNRQRGKSSANEPPSLGALKQGQSQSFPRNPEIGAFDPIGSRRRRGSYGNWANPVAGLLNRNTDGPNSSPEDNGFISVRTGTGRRSRLNMFGSKLDGIGSPGLSNNHSSSRPSSTYSYDTGLGVSSCDSQRYGWSVSESIPNRISPLPLGSGWPTPGGPWSRGQSRRTSMQHGSTSNLSIGSTPLESEGYSGSLAKQVPEQLPIGTRPQSSQRPVTPKLNPAAPTFKTLFSRGDTKRAAKADKSVDKSSDKPKSRDFEKHDGEEIESQQEESSPPNSRLSRDAQSIATATSVADSYESLDRSTSGTPSETVTPSGPKETLIQKITRKSSSSKFNVPWAKERSGLFSNKRAGEPSTPDEINEDTWGEYQPGKNMDTLGSTLGSTLQQEKGSRATLSWPNIRRKSKRNGQATVETTGRNSEAWEDDDN